MATLEPIKKTRLSNAVTVQLTRLIVSGEIAAGERLPPERELSQRLSITRTSLRESLRKMENMGLVSIRPGDGIYAEDYRSMATLDFVRFILSEGVNVDLDLIRAIEEVRRIFSVKLIELAAEQIGPGSVKTLRDIVEQCPDQDAGKPVSGEWDFLFYHEIARATGNRLFVYMLNSIKDVFVQLRWLYNRFDAVSDPIRDLNRKVVDALESGNGPLAVSLVETRMKRDSELLKQLLDAGDLDAGVTDSPGLIKLVPPRRIPHEPSIGPTKQD